MQDILHARDLCYALLAVGLPKVEVPDADITRSNRREPPPSGVHDPPQLRVVAWPLGPGDGLEVLCLREICLEEAAAADLLNGEERTTVVQQPPQLSGVLLSRAGYHAEVETRDLVCIKEAPAGDLLYAIQASLHLRQNPALRVVVLGLRVTTLKSRCGISCASRKRGPTSCTSVTTRTGIVTRT
jgi:hypothetical protein